MSEQFDLLDKTIDAALESYTPPSARPGLDRRVLASVAGARIAGPWGAGWWNRRLAWAACAVLLAVGLLPMLLRQERLHPVAVHAPSGSDAIDRTAAAASPVATPARFTPVAHPLRRSAETVSPPAAHRDAAPAVPQSFEPLQEDAIEIKPLRIAPIRIAALN